MRRAGFTGEERLELRRLYHFLFRSGRNLRMALAEAVGQFPSPAARHLIEFLAVAKRGVCRDTGNRRDAAGEEKD